MQNAARILLLTLSICIASHSFCQQREFSIATDLGIQRSFKKEQRYWAVGHTVNAHFHLTPKDGLYAWISYYSNGKFNNNLVATAKSPTTSPQNLNHTNSSLMRFKQISIGWKKYLKGAYNAETWNIYGYTGFGLMIGRVENRLSTPVDTTLYNTPVLNGKANFKRLSLDLGLGWEAFLGGSSYVYIEGRAWIPTSDYPSKHILVNNNAPLIGMLSLGVRVLFD